MGIQSWTKILLTGYIGGYNRWPLQEVACFYNVNQKEIFLLFEKHSNKINMSFEVYPHIPRRQKHLKGFPIL